MHKAYAFFVVAFFVSFTWACECVSKCKHIRIVELWLNYTHEWVCLPSQSRKKTHKNKNHFPYTLRQCVEIPSKNPFGRHTDFLGNCVRRFVRSIVSNWRKYNSLNEMCWQAIRSICHCVRMWMCEWVSPQSMHWIHCCCVQCTLFELFFWALFVLLWHFTHFSFGCMQTNIQTSIGRPFSLSLSLFMLNFEAEISTFSDIHQR